MELGLPDEIKRRENRLAAIATTKAKIEARAKERYEQKQVEHAAKLATRSVKEAATGKKPGGKPPTPPASGPRADDQINLTDTDSRIMKVASGSFEQCYNVQALVDTESMQILLLHVTQATNDMEQVKPIVTKMPEASFVECFRVGNQPIADLPQRMLQVLFLAPPSRGLGQGQKHASAYKIGINLP